MIGGLKEKLLAALRGGIRKVIIPQENVKDLQEIPDNVREGLEIIPVRWIDEVLAVALETQPQPLLLPSQAFEDAPLASGNADKSGKIRSKRQAVKH